MSRRRISARPYFWELFSVANLILIVSLFYDHDAILGTLWGTMVSFGGFLLIEAIAGVMIRWAIAAVRGESRSYLRIITSASWLADTLRLVVVGSLMIHAYLWVKLAVPILHPRLFDQQLWDLDRQLLFGHSPNILVLDLFSNPYALRFVDWSYVTIFFTSMTVGFIFFLSAPSRRIRMAFMSGMAVMWLVGAWLYVLIPSLGPAYGFSREWFPYSEYLRTTQAVQSSLMRNYQHVMHLRSAGSMVDIKLGIGAFPSLHVATQTFMLLWMRKLWTWGEIVFGVFLVIIFLGSLITGWHYLIDALAGVLLASLSYLIMARIYRVNRWVRLRT